MPQKSSWNEEVRQRRQRKWFGGVGWIGGRVKGGIGGGRIDIWNGGSRFGGFYRG